MAETIPPAGAPAPGMPADRIEDLQIERELQDSYLTYAMSTIMDRALPDVRDGLKPSQRRILVAANDLNLRPPKKHMKCAKISGDTSGNYHPHGEGLEPALHADRRSGKLRQQRRRPARGDAIHRSASRAAGGGDDGGSGVR